MRRLAIIAAVGLLAGSAQAQEPSAPLEGYTCATLNLTDQQMRDPSLSVPILSEPRSGSQQIGEAASIVFAKKPAHVVNGFAEVMFPTGRPGWISAKLLRPVQMSCRPIRAADGKVRIGR